VRSIIYDSTAGAEGGGALSALRQLVAPVRRAP